LSPVPNCPYELLPHVHTVPSVFNAAVCVAPISNFGSTSSLTFGSSILGYCSNVNVTDKNGTVKLLPDYDVKIEVVGAASLQGYGSAAYQNAEHYDQHHHKSWQGHLQAVLRSTEKTGPVTVTFTADGCAPAILHLSAE